MMVLKIVGRPISKKNSKRWIIRGGKRFLVPSEAYSNFEEHATYQIKDQLRQEPRPIFSGKVHVNYEFRMKGLIRADVDNLVSGINDILKKAGVIVDDNLITDGCFRKISGCKEWETTIKISLPIDNNWLS